MSTSTTTSTAPPADQPLRVRDLYAELGEARIQALSQEFYDRVYADEGEAWFRDMFAVTAATPKDLAVFSQVCFFVQRFGGDPFYGGLQKDSAFVREVHHHFLINHKAYERWMHHMKGALENVDLGPRGEEVKEVLVNYFSAFGKSVINSKNESAYSAKKEEGAEQRKEEKKQKKSKKTKDKKEKTKEEKASSKKGSAAPKEESPID